MKRNVRQLLWVLLPFIACLGILATLYFALPPSDSFPPRFIVTQNYIRLLLHDRLFLPAVFHTVLYGLSLLGGGLVLGTGFSCAIKKRKAGGQTPLILAAVVLFQYLFYSLFLGDGSGLYPKSLPGLIAYGILFIAAGFSVYLSVAKRQKSIYAQNAVKYGGVIVFTFVSMRFYTVRVALMEFPDTEYEAHAVIRRHWNDYGQIGLSVTDDFSVSLFYTVGNLALGILICFLYWSAEKAFLGLLRLFERQEHKRTERQT